MMTIVKEIAVVRKARVVDSGRRAADSKPPVDDATMRVTTGKSHTAAIFEKLCA